MDLKAKYFFAQVKDINERDRTLDAVASTADMDRDNEIILPAAFKDTVAAFKANPVVLACHQHRLPSGSSPVIGSVLPESIAITDSQVLFGMRFAETPLGNEYWQLYKDRHMRAFSIGFIGIEWTDEKDEKLGYIRTYTKIELLEISAVPVPSNRAALVRAKGFYETEDATEAIVARVEQAVKGHIDRLEERVAAANAAIDDLTVKVMEIIDMINTDPRRLARSFGLGDDYDRPDRSGDAIAENCERIQKAFPHGG